MNDPVSWIAGLQRENSDALGFIPEPTIRERYIALNRYVLQHDEVGNPVGFVLHGALQPGRVLTIAQACVCFDDRMRGYGEAAIREIVERARVRGMQAVALRCAEDLDSNGFWESLGFSLEATLSPGNRRNRNINVWRRNLWKALF